MSKKIDSKEISAIMTHVAYLNINMHTIARLLESDMLLDDIKIHVQDEMDSHEEAIHRIHHELFQVFKKFV